MKKCIWCLHPNQDAAKEHIIPEALGCPQEFIFKDGTVCQSCNNKLAYLDRAVIDDFDIFLFQAGVKRKHNKLPSIKSRGNLSAGYGPEGKFIAVNMGPGSVLDSLGNTLIPFKEAERHINAKFETDGTTAKISYDVKFAMNKKFRRGIYKIAFNSLAFFLGRDKALLCEFNSIRDFVVKGRGDRVIFMKPTNDKIFMNQFINQVWPPYVNACNFYSMVLRIGFIEFVVDLSPNQSITPVLMEKSKEIFGTEGWTYMPKCAE